MSPLFRQRRNSLVGCTTCLHTRNLELRPIKKKAYDIVTKSNPDEIKTIVLVKKYEKATFEPDFIGFNLALNQESLYKNKVKEYLLFGYGSGLNGMYQEIDHIGWVEVLT